jgi:hypothetical protein
MLLAGWRPMFNPGWVNVENLKLVLSCEYLREFKAENENSFLLTHSKQKFVPC